MTIKENEGAITEKDQRLRILYLMKLLLEKTDDEHSMTREMISNELVAYGFSVNRKTFYADIHSLSEYGLDIVMEKKGLNVVYHICSRDFELPELKLLVDSVQSSRFITEKKSEYLIEKLEKLTSVYEGRQLHRQVYVSGRIKAGNENIYYNVDYIHNAISQNVSISFQYFQWSVDKKKKLRHNGKIYRVSPWALTWDNENYYMVGFDESIKEIRHYRVDKMLNIELSEDERIGQEQFEEYNLATYTNRLFGMFDGEEKLVRLRVHNDFAGIIIDRFGLDIEFNKIDSNWFKIEVKVAVSDQFLSWIISLGEKVIIVEPKDVVVKMKEIGERIWRMYGG